LKKVYIIHGWEGSPEGNWFPWLKKELESRDFEVYVPAMPDSDNPKFSGWLSELKKVVGDPNENIYLVGHSLGVITILRYLESLSSDQKIGGIILVAGFPESIGYEELSSFFEKPVDYSKVKEHVSKIIAINSDNDPYVPLKNGEILRDKLNAKLIIVPKAGHINADDGYLELPAALDELLKMAK